MTSKRATFDILLVTEHFSPSTGATAQLMSDLTQDLSSYGFNVAVLTATSGPSNKAYPVFRLCQSRSQAVGILLKSARGLIFFINCSIWLLKHSRSVKSVLIASNPPFVGLLGSLVCNKIGIPYVFLFQDLFPRSAALAGILPPKGPVYTLWKQIIRHILVHSHKTIVLSHSMINRCMVDYGIKGNVSAIENWSVIAPKEADSVAAPQPINTEQQLTIQYSGNFGRLHELLTILEVARLHQNSNYIFEFVGDGAKKNQVEQYVSRYGLNNVLIKPYVAREQLLLSLSTADICVVSLIPGAEDTVSPSKLYGILSVAKPVLLIASKDSEIAHLVDHHRCGFVVQPGDVLELSKVINTLSLNPQLLAELGRNAFTLYSSQMGRSRSTDQYIKLFSHIIQGTDD